MYSWAICDFVTWNEGFWKAKINGEIVVFQTCKHLPAEMRLLEKSASRGSGEFWAVLEAAAHGLIRDQVPERRTRFSLLRAALARKLLREGMKAQGLKDA